MYHLKRSIYGLNKSSKFRYFRFHEAITSLSLSVVSEDHCVYVKKATRGIVFLALYVDDILLAGKNLDMIKATKR